MDPTQMMNSVMNSTATIPASPPQIVITQQPSKVWEAFYAVLSATSAALSGYHGYRRHRGSIGWGLAWFALGGIFPVITPTFAFAQGFGKAKS